MIRKFKEADTDRVMQIWLEGNLEAHPFIPCSYWTENYDMVQSQLAQAEIGVWETDGSVQGFIGVVEGYIAGIFVASKYRSVGGGARLLEYAKQSHTSLTLNVYQRNSRAVDFYLRQGFWIKQNGMDEETGEKEYTMCWRMSGK